MDNRFANISTLIVKVTHRCNLDCHYCYENITKQGQDMPLQTFKDLADIALSQSRQSRITFLFHGGEPTLLPNDWYDQAINYARQKAQQLGKEARFSMQTNLLGLNPNKIALFQRHNIELGISLDGPAQLQSTMRGGEDKVFQHFKQIQSLGIRAGVLVTINHSNYQHFFTICDWLVREANIKTFKANVVTPVGRGYDIPPLAAENIFEAQHAILQYMLQTEGRSLLEDNIMVELQRFFESPLQQQNRPRSLCHEQRCGAGESVLGVTPQGDLLPCGRFTWDEQAHYIGSLHDDLHSQPDKLQQFHDKLQRFHDLVPQSWYDCAQCPAKNVCGFGCQAFIVRSKAQANLDCLPTKMRFQFYQTHREALQKVLHNALNIQRPPTPFRIRQKDGTVKTYTLS